MLDVLGLDEVDAVIGGPPCQGFSSLGKQDPNDPRNELVFEFVRLAKELRARTIVMENVPRMASMLTREGLPVLDVLTEMLEGYGDLAKIRSALGGRTGARAFTRTRRAAAKSAHAAPEQPTLFDDHGTSKRVSRESPGK